MADIPLIPLVMLEIDREGRWTTEGEPIQHAGILHYLHSHLRRNSEGRYIIDTGKQAAYVEVADTPFVVKRVDFEENAGRVSLLLSDETEEELLPERLEMRGDDLYCRVKSGEYEARFCRGPYHELLNRCEELPAGLGLRLGSREVILRS